MQFSIIITGHVSALISTSAAAALDLGPTAPKALATRTIIDECTEENDCCISTHGACRRQAFNWAENYLTCPFIKLCPDLGVPWSSCNAEFYAISTKWGRGCPGI